MTTEPGIVEHAQLVVPGLLWLVGVLGVAVIGLMGIILAFIWKRMCANDTKLDDALTYLYAVCLKLHPEGLDCDEIRKSLCSVP